MGKLHVGMAGWTYEPWRGTFYPEGLRVKHELAYASRKVRAVEVNGTFYSLLRPSSYESWYQETPQGFAFTLKGPRYLTHIRRLKDFEEPLANFLASGPLALKEKLGAILWQFAPGMPFIAERFEPFMAALPHDTAAAAALAEAGMSPWMRDRSYTAVDTPRKLRHAIEVRHASFANAEFVAMARRYGVAIVVGDTAGRWPLIEDVTADFVYVRLHADETIYPQGYTGDAIELWLSRLMAWAEGGEPEDAKRFGPPAAEAAEREVFAFFDNDTKDTAPQNALAMTARLVEVGALPELTYADLPVAMKRKPGKKKTAGEERARKAAKPAKTSAAGRAKKRRA
jgi:uncharacterized protein YecE (DUF72 family)